ncbi:hypothetical protein ACQ86B_07775 [Mycolicibacterium aichiense]|uniref:hypothetical protein n=1 Tax=Mycolicibacterium aichiense TaxID=1799 RepID=UPI003D66B88A
MSAQPRKVDVAQAVTLLAGKDARLLAEFDGYPPLAVRNDPKDILCVPNDLT